MIVWGTANPCGVSDVGPLFSVSDIEYAVRDLVGKDVKCEHSGSVIGRVLSAWQYDGALQCVFRLDPSLNASVAGNLIKKGVCSELSLGYTVDMSMSAQPGVGSAVAFGRKRISELSVVVKGARHGCCIHGYAE